MNTEVQSPDTTDVDVNATNATPPETPKDGEGKPRVFTEAEVQSLLKDALQRETDRRVTPISQELKKTREQLEEIKKQSMSEAQRKQYELEQREAKYAEELQEKSNQLSRYMTMAELNRRGWDESLTEFVLDSTEDGVRAKADKLAKLIEVEVAKARSTAISKSSIVPPTKSSSTGIMEEVDYNDPIAFAAAVRAGKATLT